MQALRNDGLDVINKCTPGAQKTIGSKQYRKEYYKSNKEYYKEKFAEHYKNQSMFVCDCCHKYF